SVAGLANLRGRLALLDRRRLQQLLDRLARGPLGLGLASLAAPLLGLDPKAPLRWLLLRQYRIRRDAPDPQHKASGDPCTEDFIDFEGVHFGSGSRPEGRGGPHRTAEWESPGSRLSQRTPRRPEISVCPWSGNPYKRAGFRQPPPIRLAFFSPVPMS